MLTAPLLLPPSLACLCDTLMDPAHEEISPVSVPRRNSAFLLSLGSRRAGREPCRDLSRCPGSASSSCTGSFVPTERQTHQEGCREVQRAFLFRKGQSYASFAVKYLGDSPMASPLPSPNHCFGNPWQCFAFSERHRNPLAFAAHSAKIMGLSPVPTQLQVMQIQVVQKGPRAEHFAKRCCLEAFFTIEPQKSHPMFNMFLNRISIARRFCHVTKNVPQKCFTELKPLTELIAPKTATLPIACLSCYWTDTVYTCRC